MEVELILKQMKKPLSDTGKSDTKLYLSKLKDDRYTIPCRLFP